MGWSCRADAGHSLDAWTKACLAQTDMQNVYTVKGVRYMFEVSNKEHDDGAITGSVLKFIDETRAIPAGSFRIEGDGTVARGPKFLKDAVKASGQRAERNGIGSGGLR